MDVSFELQMLGKVVIAAMLGGIVGLEREFAERPAGLRTHMLVGATSAFFVMHATHMISSFEPQDIVTVDPVRVVEAIVVGISFLGAGTILKYTREGQGVVEGLTTSASIWSGGSDRDRGCFKCLYCGSWCDHPKFMCQLGTRLYLGPFEAKW